MAAIGKIRQLVPPLSPGYHKGQAGPVLKSVSLSLII